MIVQARTPKALSWAGRLGVLGLAALILPLAPTWAQNQKADTPKPDGGRDTATADVKPDGDINANKARQQLKGEVEDDDRDELDTPKGVSDHLDHLLKDLGERLSKDLSPVGDEVAKALDKAAKEVTEALDKEGITSKDLRQALEKARDKLKEAFKEGGPVDKQAVRPAHGDLEGVEDVKGVTIRVRMVPDRPRLKRELLGPQALAHLQQGRARLLADHWLFLLRGGVRCGRR